MRWPARTFAALLLCVLTLAACTDEIDIWQPAAELGVCGRSPAVRDAIVAATDRVRSCADVDADDLTAIRQLDLSDRGIIALQTDDFAGLTRLRALRLNGNALRLLPEGLFEGLATLRMVHLHDNPGSPFALRVELRFNQRERERLLYLRLPLRPPSRVVAHLQGDGVLLADFAAVIDEGSYVSAEIRVGRDSTSAGTARVLRVAADQELHDCGGEPCWTGIRLRPGSAPVAVPALPGDGEPPQGLPTLVLRVDRDSFAHDASVERGVIADSGRWLYYQSAEKPPDLSDFTGECVVTQYTTVTSGRSGTSGMYEYDGQCRLAMSSGSRVPAGQLPLGRIAEHLADQADSGSCRGLGDLRIVAGADSFSAAERLDAVDFDAEGRCYHYISVAQDPNREAPFRFGEGESCVVEVVDRRVSASGVCGELVWWSGWGIGGIDSLADARADAALTRPYLNGEEQLKRRATIAACETLPPVSLALDADSFGESPLVYQSVTDEQGLCALTISAIAREDALAHGEQCVVTAEFAFVDLTGSVPTRQSGDCERIVHSADWSEAHGDRWSDDDVQRFLEQYVAYIESFSDADWQRLRESHFCIDEICSRVPSSLRDE